MDERDDSIERSMSGSEGGNKGEETDEERGGSRSQQLWFLNSSRVGEERAEVGRGDRLPLFRVLSHIDIKKYVQPGSCDNVRTVLFMYWCFLFSSATIKLKAVESNQTESKAMLKHTVQTIKSCVHWH